MSLKSIWSTYKNQIIVVLVPLIFSPLVFSGSDQAKCAYVVALMAVYWITEALPLAVTAFLPIICYPLLGILEANKTAMNYLKDTNFLFVGGIMVALATEECNLHKRLALKVLLTFGAQPRWLMLGFMIPSAFLSMWMSNVATVAMMAPIATCVLIELIAHAKSDAAEKEPMKNGASKGQMADSVAIELSEINENGAPDSKMLETTTVVYSSRNGSSKLYPTATVEAGVQTIPESPKAAAAPKPAAKSNADQLCLDGLAPEMKGLCKAIMLALCYSASIGGTGTLTGTGPNVVITGQLAAFFPNQDSVTFATWMAFAVPPMILCTIVCWLLLLSFFVGWKSIFNKGPTRQKSSSDGGITAILRKRYEELGEMSFAEYSVMCWFIFLVVVWVFRDPKFMPGWESLLGLKKKYNSDAVAAMLVAVILFVWPNKRPGAALAPGEKRGNLLNWGIIQKKFPWSVIILLGGGYAMADGVDKSHLGSWLGCSMKDAVGHLSVPVITFIMTSMVCAVTQIAANSAVATIFIPVLVSMAGILNVNPLYFLLPTTVAASYAYVLPVSTPPNAVIFEFKMMALKDMMVPGAILSFLCVVIIMLNTFTVADWLFNLNEMPHWAINTTVAASRC